MVFTPTKADELPTSADPSARLVGGVGERYVLTQVTASEVQSANANGTVNSGYWIADGASFLVDATYSYSLGAGLQQVAAGSIIQFRSGGSVRVVAQGSAQYTGYHVANANGVLCTVDAFPSGGMFAAAWGVSASNTAATNATRLQDAVWSVLESGERRIILPNGIIQSNVSIKLWRPGVTSRALHGKITFEGQGDVDVGWAKGASTGVTGTVLQFTHTDATPGLWASEADASFLRRAILVRNIHIQYAGTGYGIVADGCPEFTMDRASVRVTSTGGRALYVRDCWNSTLEKSRLIGIGGTSTVEAFSFGETTFAGVFTVRDSIINQFYNGIVLNAGANFATVTIEKSAIQDMNNYGIHVLGPIWNLSINESYFEGNDVSDIVVDPTAGTVSSISIDGMFKLGGTASASHSSGPAVSLKNVDSYDIKQVMFYRPWQPFLYLDTGVDNGKLSNITVKHDQVANLPAGPLYMLTAVANSKFFLDNNGITSSSKLAWFNPALHRITGADSKGLTGHALSFGAMAFATVTNASAYDMANADPRPVVAVCTNTSAGAGAARLPRANASTASDTDFRMIINSPTSTQNILVRNGSLAGNIATLTPGQGGLCYSDKANDKWVIVYTTAVHGT